MFYVFFFRNFNNKLIFREFSLLLSSLQTETRMRIHQSNYFSTSLKQDIIKEFKTMIKDQNHKAKILTSEGKKIEKEMKNYLDSLEKVYFNIKVIENC